MKFNKWYYVGDKCDTRRFSGTNRYYTARDAWEESKKQARKGYVKLDDVLEILKDNTFHNEHGTALIAYRALDEIMGMEG